MLIIFFLISIFAGILFMLFFIRIYYSCSNDNSIDEKEISEEIDVMEKWQIK